MGLSGIFHHGTVMAKKSMCGGKGGGEAERKVWRVGVWLLTKADPPQDCLLNSCNCLCTIFQTWVALRIF